MPKNIRKRSAGVSHGVYPLNLEEPVKELERVRKELGSNTHMNSHTRKGKERRTRVLEKHLRIPFLNRQMNENAKENATELNRMAGKGGARRSTRRNRRKSALPEK